MAGTQFIIFINSQAVLNKFKRMYDKDVELFYKDPLNKVKHNKPIDYWTYVSRHTDRGSAQAKSYNAFYKKFGKETVEKVKRAVIDYVTMKTNKVVLPSEVEKYLNS